MRLRKNNFRLSSLTVQITLLWFSSEITPVKCSGSFWFQFSIAYLFLSLSFCYLGVALEKGPGENDELKLREFHKSVKKHTLSQDPSWRGKERLKDESKKSTLQETTKQGTEPE